MAFAVLRLSVGAAGYGPTGLFPQQPTSERLRGGGSGRPPNLKRTGARRYRMMLTTCRRAAPSHHTAYTSGAGNNTHRRHTSPVPVKHQRSTGALRVLHNMPLPRGVTALNATILVALHCTAFCTFIQHVAHLGMWGWRLFRDGRSASWGSIPVVFS